MNSQEYNDGWNDGYEDREYYNPHIFGTKEYEDYDKGYEQGSKDC